MCRFSRLLAATGLIAAVTVPRVAAAQARCPRASLPAYAHNDYQNARPLDEALERGFRGIEVDVFLVDGTLRVGHDRRAARRGGTLEAIYLGPLRTLAERCGTLTADGRPFLVFVELKEHTPATYDALVHLLSGYQALFAPTAAAPVGRSAVEIVLVGWHPATPQAALGVDSLLRVHHRLVRPGPLVPHDPAGRLRMLSVDYGKTIGRWWRTPAGRRRWLARLRAVKGAAPTRLLRVHNVPPDAGVYTMLLEAGVDLIGTKQLATTQRLLSTSSSR